MFRNLTFALVSTLLITTTTINAQPLGPNWVGQIGGDQSEKGIALSYDQEGNILSCGTFQYIADLDPGIGEDLHTALGYQDSYIIKVSPEGSLIWAKTLGGDDG